MMIRWNAARPGCTLEHSDDVSRLFENLQRHPLAGVAGPVAMPVDVEETPEAYVLRADLPGMSQKDIKVTLAGDTLTLRAERQREAEKREGAVHRTERRYGAFERAFTLSEPVKADQVKASYRDGVLEVVVPKAEEARSREIEVQVG